jgi:hypothetical protein
MNVQSKTYEQRRTDELKAELILLQGKIDRSFEEEAAFRRQWLVSIDGHLAWRTTLDGRQAPALQRELDTIVGSRGPLIAARNKALSELATLSG